MVQPRLFQLCLHQAGFVCSLQSVARGQSGPLLGSLVTLILHSAGTIVLAGSGVLVDEIQAATPESLNSDLLMRAKKKKSPLHRRHSRANDLRPPKAADNAASLQG